MPLKTQTGAVNATAVFLGTAPARDHHRLGVDQNYCTRFGHQHVCSTDHTIYHHEPQRIHEPSRLSLH